jgi:hypothetical protein
MTNVIYLKLGQNIGAHCHSSQSMYDNNVIYLKTGPNLDSIYDHTVIYLIPGHNAYN